MKEKIIKKVYISLFMKYKNYSDKANVSPKTSRHRKTNILFYNDHPFYIQKQCNTDKTLQFTEM